MDLSSEAIRPDVANTAPLTRREITELLPEVRGWSLKEGASPLDLDSRDSLKPWHS